MIERVQDKPKLSRIGAAERRRESLPYRVELCSEGDRDAIERVLARAFNAALARAIFAAAMREHPGRRITLRRGPRLIADSAEEPEGAAS